LKGIYVLIIQLSSDVTVQVGALGKLTFKKDLYAYVGSAQNNLEKRVNRHLRKKKRKFWHIDYLLDNEATKVITVFHKQAGKAEECAVARAIGERGEAVAGFGASDCNCKSHLYHIEDYGFLRQFMCENAPSLFYLSSSGRLKIKK
jgi:Uri superfamily endonuclease